MKVPVYFDANAIIRLAEYRDAPLLRFLRRLGQQGIPFCTSELSLAEVLVVPLRKGTDDLVRHYESFLRNNADIMIVPVDRQVLTLSAKFRASFGGKTPDMIHVASASIAGCKLVVSSDKRLRMPPEIQRIGLEELDGVNDPL